MIFQRAASWAFYLCGLFWHTFATRWFDGTEREWVWRIAYGPYNYFMVKSASVQGDTENGPWR